MRSFEEGTKDSDTSGRGSAAGFSEAISAGGAEIVEFLVSPNPGFDLMPLARIASGGELSRVMLALKKNIASRPHGRVIKRIKFYCDVLLRDQ